MNYVGYHINAPRLPIGGPTRLVEARNPQGDIDLNRELNVAAPYTIIHAVFVALKV